MRVVKTTNGYRTIGVGIGAVANWLKRSPCSAESTGSSLVRDSYCVGTLSQVFAHNCSAILLHLRRRGVQVHFWTSCKRVDIRAQSYCIVSYCIYVYSVFSVVRVTQLKSVDYRCIGLLYIEKSRASIHRIKKFGFRFRRCQSQVKISLFQQNTVCT